MYAEFEEIDKYSSKFKLNKYPLIGRQTNTFRSIDDYEFYIYQARSIVFENKFINNLFFIFSYNVLITSFINMWTMSTLNEGNRHLGVLDDYLYAGNYLRE